MQLPLSLTTAVSAGCEILRIYFEKLNLTLFSVLESELIFVNAVTAGGVNFSRNNAIYNINESTKYILS